MYCDGRKPGDKRPPKVADSFFYRAQVVTPVPGLDDLVGVISNVYVNNYIFA